MRGIDGAERAHAVTAAGTEREPLFLARLALLLFERVGDEAACREALADALRSGQVAGAALDVFETEPATSSPLFALDNVVLLPHLASNTHETRAAMAQRVEDNLAAFLAGKPMISAAA